jgi:hypothetical protein
MPKFEKGNDFGVRFGEGQDPTRGGRKKKIYTVLKEKGFSKDDIRSAFLELMHYDIAELNELINRNKGKTASQIDEEGSSVPVLYVIVARALIKANSKGEMKFIDKLVEQVIGKSHQTSDNKVSVVEIPASRLELEKRLAEIELIEIELEEINKRLEAGANIELDDIEKKQS